MSHPRDPTGQPADEGLDILNGDGATSSQPRLRWKPVPAIILALAVVYSVTVVVGSITIVAVEINRNSVARACIEAGGQWVISESGDRECTRTEKK